MPQAARPQMIGARLRERRLHLGLRQAEVAGRAGISASYLNLIEHDRRNVTEEVLERLATALMLDLGEFMQKSPQQLIEDLRNAAANFPSVAVELDQIEELSRRFPGWAALVSAQQSQITALERSVMALNDRIGHDPHLSAALHELLSALSAVRSTATILAETDDLTAERQHRFHHNLFQDSERLATGAQDLISWLDKGDPQGETGRVTLPPQDHLERWLTARHWLLPEVETGHLETLEEELSLLPGDDVRSLARYFLEEARQDAVRMPLGEMIKAMAEAREDPALIAARFGVPVLAAMRRIAFVKGGEAGFVTCDASGSLLWRKPVAGFALPKFGAACALWPLYIALGRAGLPIDLVVETPAPGGGLFRCLAICETSYPQGFSGPETRLAGMLILPLAQSGKEALAVGSTCRICPRAGCPARREASILASLP